MLISSIRTLITCSISIAVRKRYAQQPCPILASSCLVQLKAASASVAEKWVLPPAAACCRPSAFHPQVSRRIALTTLLPQLHARHALAQAATPSRRWRRGERLNQDTLLTIHLVPEQPQLPTAIAETTLRASTHRSTQSRGTAVTCTLLSTHPRPTLTIPSRTRYALLLHSRLEYTFFFDAHMHLSL